MPTFSLGTHLTVAELVRRKDPQGRLVQLIDMLNQEHHILDYITWIECNNGTYHEDTRTAFEPTGQERVYDEGVTKEAGGTDKVTEPTCMLNGLSEVDRKKIQHTGNEAGNRLMEDSFFLRGMTKTFVTRLFSGNRGTNPKQINGLNVRSDYANLVGSGGRTDCVFDNAGGNASMTSNKTCMWIIQFGQKMVNCIYPLNDPQGGGEFPIKMEDFGLNMVTDALGKKYPAYQTWFGIDFGWFIHDPRCIKRIVNISTTNVDGVDDIPWNENVMIQAMNTLQYNKAGAVILCSGTALTQAQQRANEKGTFITTQREGEGPFAGPVTRFAGIPMVQEDAITNSQATIT